MRMILSGWLGFSFLIALICSSCRIDFLADPSPTPVPELTGKLVPWTATSPIDGRHVLLCQSLGDPRQGNCLLMDSAIESDKYGRFAFYGVEIGTYFIMYDSGLSDFDSAMTQWGGQVLHFGDRVWLSEFLGVDLNEDEIELRVPDGISLSPHTDWLSSYGVLTLMLGNSPFIIAHDMEKARDSKELQCQIVQISPGKTINVQFRVIYYGD